MCDSGHTVWVTLRITIKVMVRDRDRVIWRVRGRSTVNVRRKAPSSLAEVVVRMAVGVLVVMAILVAVSEFLVVGLLVVVAVLVPVDARVDGCTG